MEKKCNTTARDVKRRLEVITTKMEDLKKLGVPCAFVHVSYWSGGLYVTGDPKITGVIQGQAQKILDELNSCDENQDEDEETTHHSNISFPSLPAPLQELNRRTLECILCKITKDLKVNWSGDPPHWWPSNIMFCHPRKTPSNLRGKLCQW